MVRWMVPDALTSLLPNSEPVDLSGEVVAARWGDPGRIDKGRPAALPVL